MVFYGHDPIKEKEKRMKPKVFYLFQAKKKQKNVIFNLIMIISIA
jgi:hypothetical protein